VVIRYTPWFWGLGLFVGIGNGACSRSIEVATLGEGSQGGGDAGCEVRPCQGRVFACGDCEDNDEDGASDVLDPDCWGECHDSEESWAPRQLCSNDSCFFDGNCGLGNDEDCLELTPNGCDCHGCCQGNQRAEPIFLGTVDGAGVTTCGASSVDDPTSCEVCVVDEQCFNACESGDVCF
jgi:hypothetical protein